MYINGFISRNLIIHQTLRETCGKQLEAKNQELVERDEQISQLTNQVNTFHQHVRFTEDLFNVT